MYWEGKHGRYAVPKELQPIIMTKSGYPDMRKKATTEKFFNWVAEQDSINSTTPAHARAAHNRSSTPTPLGDSIGSDRP